MKKRVICLLLVLCMVLSLTPTVFAASSTEIKYAVEGGYIYFDKATGTITDCDSTVTAANIPAMIDGTAVTNIEYAFSYCSALTNIRIPNSVTSINDGFSGCSILTGIWVDAGNLNYSSDSHGVLYNKDKTVLVKCPSAFSGTYEIPDSVAEIKNAAFSSCSSLTSITIPDSVISIESFVFEKCTSLTSVRISNNVKSIEAGAFKSCSSLTEITIPDNVTEIGYTAFSGCSGLTSLSLPENLIDIYDFAFENCTALGSVTLPENLTYIGKFAFDGCSNLASITIPERVTNIDDCAFFLCSALTSITIPKSVTHIGFCAFYGCRLTGIWVNEENPSYISDSNGVLFNKDKTVLISYPCKLPGRYVIPDNVTTIDSYAFARSGLTNITIPETVTKINKGAFYSCSTLTSIKIMNPSCNISDVPINPSASYNYNLNFFTFYHYSGGGGGGAFAEIDYSLLDLYTLGVPGETTVYGYPDSTAQKNAKNNGFDFVALDGEPDGKHEFKFHGNLLTKEDAAEKDVCHYDTATCYYYDSYFSEDATKYNASLATMSLCFEIACNPAGGNSKWTTDVREDNPQFKYARDLLIGDIKDDEDTGLGFTDFAVNDDWSAPPERDTIGVVAARKTLSDGSNLIAVGIRGAKYAAEWAGNLTVGSSGEHTGFDRAKNTVLDFLNTYIEDCYNYGHMDTTKDIKLWIVGYSRAGAVANLTAGAINNNNYNSSLYYLKRIKKENLYAYCFAVPMGTIQSNANDSKHSNIHNVINYNDLVPMVAPSSWGFKRFNQYNDVLRPYKTFVPYTDFIDYQKSFNEIYSQFKHSDDEDFKNIVTDYTTITGSVDINFDWLSTKGAPLLTANNKTISTHSFLQQSVNIIANDIVGDRETYYNELQAGIRDILAAINGENISASFANQLSAEEFLEHFFDKFSFDTLVDIASPMFELNLSGVLDITNELDRRLNNCKLKLNDYIRGITGDSELAGTILFSETLNTTLTNIIWKIFKDSLIDLSNGDLTKYSTIAATIVNYKRIFRAHYTEINLAWLMAVDPNYAESKDKDTDNGSNRLKAVDKNYTEPKYKSADNGTNRLQAVDESYTERKYDNTRSDFRIVRINCPVDVYVYDESGNLIASIIDKELKDDTIIAYENINGEIVLELPAVEEYSLKIVAHENCSVSYSVEEISSGGQDVAQITAFDPVEVQANESLQAVIPAIEDRIGETGSNATYVLKKENAESANKTSVDGGQYYSVSLSRNNRYGLVMGSGQFTYGSFAQVNANPIAGAEFVGWYVNESMVSSESTYRFRVTEDIALQAVFTEPKLHTISVEAETGGTVENEPSLLLAEGTHWALEAKCDNGYTFVGWETTSGEIEDASSLITTFTAANEDAVIKAIFRPTLLFTDVNSTDYFYNAVKWAAENGITTGTEPGLFAPNAAITRAQFVTFLWRAVGCPEAKEAASFTDLEDGAYYNDAVAWAVEKGITNGVGKNMFAPEDNCTRGQIVTLLWRYLNKPAATASVVFTDVEPDEYYTDAVAWAANTGVAYGVNDALFKPDGDCTRGQSVTFLQRAIAG